jgi:glycosyltransferase involved in cell wall biosynthesis
MGLKGKVIFIKEANRRRVMELLRGCSIFTLPSLREGLPMALLEAMASRKPVAASEIPSIKEVLGDAGVFFNPYDPSSIASAISSLLEDEDLREELGASGRALVEEKYDWNVVLPKVEQMYDEVA